MNESKNISLNYTVVDMPVRPLADPCPWCGSGQLEMQKGSVAHYWIQCRNFDHNEDGCFASGPVGNTRVEAVRYWNERKKSACQS